MQYIEWRIIGQVKFGNKLYTWYLLLYILYMWWMEYIQWNYEVLNGMVILKVNYIDIANGV